MARYEAAGDLNKEVLMNNSRKIQWIWILKDLTFHHFVAGNLRQVTVLLSLGSFDQH